MGIIVRIVDQDNKPIAGKIIVSDSVGEIVLARDVPPGGVELDEVYFNDGYLRAYANGYSDAGGPLSLYYGEYTFILTKKVGAFGLVLAGAAAAAVLYTLKNS
jgi:hypothetical protein